jgi:hypothetical protein
VGIAAEIGQAEIFLLSRPMAACLRSPMSSGKLAAKGCRFHFDLPRRPEAT